MHGEVRQKGVVRFWVRVETATFRRSGAPPDFLSAVLIMLTAHGKLALRFRLGFRNAAPVRPSGNHLIRARNRS